ncbi:phage Gp37/Gp68 family protein [Candidatus Pacearchaeota archaeon]|jgi:protein gp37|nr:phage Gp37/Gp68 family protein [Candidatus Pacearchaeota archaeon]
MSNPIGWCDRTINPITGCRNGCQFCYAERFAKRLKGRAGYPVDDPFRPTFHFDKLAKLTGLKGRGKRIFLDSMGDWFSHGVDRAWVWAIVDAVRDLPSHTFMVLTKRPDRMQVVLGGMIGPMPANLWFGVSVTCQADLWRIGSLISGSWPHNFVSFEPLHGQVELDLAGIEWVIVGAQSGPGKLAPNAEWVADICKACDLRDIPVFLKDNLLHVVGGPLNFPPKNEPLRQEFPEEMQR